MRVALTMIVRNEETDLPICLASSADLFDEIIVVDTGSTDRTKEIAAQFGAKVFDFPWVDDFAAARNESLRHATCPWVFRLDADEVIDEPDRRQLRALFAGLKNEKVAYVSKCLTQTDESGVDVSIIEHVRLWRNQPEIRWRYRIHEQILAALENAGHRIERTGATIRHLGFLNAEQRARKRDRDLRLLRLENAEHPDDPFVLFNLGWTCQELGLWEEARVAFERSLERSAPTLSYLGKLYVLLTRLNRTLGRDREAWAICRAGLEREPENPELLYQEAWLLYASGDYAGCERNLLRVLHGAGGPSGGFDFGVDPGLRGYVTRHNLAVLYRNHNRPAEAEEQWKAVVAEKPRFHAGWLGLGELYLAQGRWDDMEHVLARLAADPQTQVEAAVLQAQKLLAQQHFGQARAVLDQTIKLAPRALGPRIILARMLCQEGRDRSAMKRSLRAVLELDPNNVEAKQNLARLENSR